MNSQRNRLLHGHYIIILTLFLSLLGLFLISSASSCWAVYKYNDELYYLKRQGAFLILGLFFLYLGYHISFDFLKKYALIILLISVILLGLVLIPGLGQVRNGSQSWLGFGPFVFQPSEVFKLALIIYAATFFDSSYQKVRKLKDCWPLIILTLLGFVLLMLQPDFGTALVMLGSVILLLFTSKLHFKYFIIIFVLGVGGLSLLVLSAPYRFLRIVSYLDPFADPLGAGFQIIQSLFAIGPSGLVGSGPGSSIQSAFYLPEPQTDFVFAIAVEEFGLFGGLLILALFGYLFYHSFKSASVSKDIFTVFLKTGLTSLLMIQTIINLGVVVGLLPVTGITLPLISYGGTSLIISLLTLGLIANPSKKGEKENVASLN